MKKYFKSVITCLIFLYFLSFSNISPIVANNYSCPSNLSPQECILWGIEQTGGEAGFDTSIVGESASWSDSVISQKIGQIISYILAFLGVLFLIISIISGLQWMR